MAQGNETQLVSEQSQACLPGNRWWDTEALPSWVPNTVGRVIIHYSHRIIVIGTTPNHRQIISLTVPQESVGTKSTKEIGLITGQTEECKYSPVKCTLHHPFLRALIQTKWHYITQPQRPTSWYDHTHLRGLLVHTQIKMHFCSEDNSLWQCTMCCDSWSRIEINCLNNSTVPQLI